MHTNSYLVAPLTNKYLQTNDIYECSLKKAGTHGICVEFTYLQTPATFGYSTTEKASEEYGTISTVTDEESAEARTFFRVFFLKSGGTHGSSPKSGITKNQRKSASADCVRPRSQFSLLMPTIQLSHHNSTTPYAEAPAHHFGPPPQRHCFT